MSKEQKSFKVKRAAAGMGLGLFASRPIKKGEFIVEYKGELISAAEAETRLTRYLFEIDDNYTIDGAARDNIARYMNHLCDPNVEAEIEAGEIKFYALKDIEEGDELGYDYGEEYVDEFIKPYGCKCSHCS
ncbi:SET domain-containing protein [Candidatus Kaiserbacteria bacterium]|nr:MAG: SET domain-containing protein [Candidatus Kaiserbacteria bacterium]